MLTWAIYKITNKINGKLYFGQTIDLISIRWREHCWKAARSESCPALGAAIRKYGEDAFSVDLVALRFDAFEADQLERELIWQHKTTERAFGYNISKGGKGYHPVYCRNGGHRLTRSGGCRICRREYYETWMPPDGSSQREYYSRKMLDYVARIDADPEARKTRLAKKAEQQRGYDLKAKQAREAKVIDS